MAALYGRRYVFSHIPKCGGKWVRAALKEADLTFNRDLTDGHAPAPAINNPKWAAFTFVRHPATWLASWYAYCQRTGWANKGRLPESFDRTKPYDRMIWETSAIDYKYGFQQWALDLEHYHPGFVGKFFAPYIRSVHHVGHQESLAEDFERFTGIAVSLDPVNVGDNLPTIPAEVWDTVHAVEPLERLGYGDDDHIREAYERRQRDISASRFLGGSGQV